MNTAKALETFAPFDNILFDFGGIFIDLDYQKTIREFSALARGIDFGALFSQANQTTLFNQLETGKISSHEFITQLKNTLQLNHLEDQKIIHAWCAMLLKIPKERVDFLKELKKTKKVFLLSNINQIHEDHVKNYKIENESIQDFYQLFDHLYFSHHIGFRKPDHEAFAFVCADSNLNLKKTIFIDDSIQHIESAKRFGLATHFLEIQNSFIIKQ